MNTIKTVEKMIEETLHKSQREIEAALIKPFRTHLTKNKYLMDTLYI